MSSAFVASNTQMATAIADLALERAWPGIGAHLPWATCSELPTAVESLARLGRHLGVERLWIKRDDRSGSLYGGNKPRKLDLLLGAALARGCKTVVTAGGIGTNHGLATAIYARRHGLRTILLLLYQPVTEKVRRNLLLCHACGADIRYGRTMPPLVARGLRAYLGELSGGLPYVIPTGGTTPLSLIAYVNAAFELRHQIEAGMLPVPDWIFVPVGSGGTFAGLVLGCKLAGLPTRVAGVLVTDILPPTAARVVRLAAKCHGLLRGCSPLVPDVRVSLEDVHIVSGFVGAGYGAPTEEARAAREEMRELEGIELETVYTGKCLAALRSLAPQREYRDANILYWNTYSSVDPQIAIGPLPDYHELPRPLWPLFEEPVVPD